MARCDTKAGAVNEIRCKKSESRNRKRGETFAAWITRRNLAKVGGGESGGQAGVNAGVGEAARQHAEVEPGQDGSA